LPSDVEAGFSPRSSNYFELGKIMKNQSPLLILVAAALGFACAYGLMRQKIQSAQSGFNQQQTAWHLEKADLTAALASAKGRVTTAPGVTKIVEVAAKQTSPAEILERLKTLRVTGDQPRSARLLTHQFETLADTGADALPVIREFLAGNVDVDYDLTSLGRNARNGKLPLDFNTPPSLRLGLFEVLKNLGGADAEKILADALTTTGRGVELAYLTRVLESLSPGKYRTAALAAAHELLARPLADASDKTDRNFLLATLSMLGDDSFAPQAQAQLIKSDGTVDTAALKYLQQTGGEKSLALAMQAYADPRVTDPKARERLAQVALDTPGINPTVDDFVRKVLADETLPALNRNNIAQDYADHGYQNFHDPTADDLLKLRSRLGQLEQMRNDITDPMVTAGIMEAIKDVNESIAHYATAHPAP
jgi:hypothetical protein